MQLPFNLPLPSAAPLWGHFSVTQPSSPLVFLKKNEVNIESLDGYDLVILYHFRWQNGIPLIKNHNDAPSFLSKPTIAKD